LRTKGSDDVVVVFLKEDAVAPSGMLSPMIHGTSASMTSRAARRFCDRLFELGVARELMGRIEAVLFASASPVGRDDLARVVGQGASLGLLIDDIQAELVRRPYELVQMASCWIFWTWTSFADAIKAAADLGERSLAFYETEMAVLYAAAYHQPITPDGLKGIFGKENSRDLLVLLRYRNMIANRPKAPRPGAPHSFVTTPEFLATFQLQSLRDLPKLELSEIL
jgi:chromosome segregation and condensation protein ScpB